MDGQLPPDGYTIWGEKYGGDGCLELYLRNDDGTTYTTTQLCQRIGASREIIEGTKEVKIWIDIDYHNNHSFDNDVEAVANLLHTFPRFNQLKVYLGPWSLVSDLTVVLLRNAPKSKIRQLDIILWSKQKHNRPVLSELEQRAWLGSLQHLVLYRANLDECDCRALGRMLKQRQGGEAFRIEFDACAFPSLAAFLVVADALFVSGPFSFGFSRNEVWVWDDTIPSSFGFGSVFYERKEGKEEKCQRFDDAATELLMRYSDFYRRLALLTTNKTATFQDWMDALCQDEVRDNVDLLFHLVRTNPGVYFGKDCPGE